MRKNAWTDGESPLVDERRFTPWAAPGWSSWNLHSPELEFCNAAARLVQHTAGQVIETGAGQGYVTRRAAVGDQPYWVYESDPAMRTLIPNHYAVIDFATPSEQDMHSCSLLLADSGIEHRLDEIKLWWSEAPLHSILLMHDAGNGHEGRGMSYTHNQHWALIKELGIPGIRYTNPRGSYLGWKRPPTAEDFEFYKSLLPT